VKIVHTGNRAWRFVAGAISRLPQAFAFHPKIGGSRSDLAREIRRRTQLASAAAIRKRKRMKTLLLSVRVAVSRARRKLVSAGRIIIVRLLA
jgi:hypothetical protein